MLDDPNRTLPESDEADEGLRPEDAPSAYDAPEIAPRTRRKGTQPAPIPPPTGRGYGCADVITAIFLLLTVAVISLTILLIANPFSPLNPLPPPTPVVQLVLATPDPTEVPTLTFTPEPPTPTIPTATTTPTDLPTATPTATPTYTPTITQTPVVGSGGGIVEITAVPELPSGASPVPATPTLVITRAAFPFSVKTIRYSANSGPEGCRWQSIAGIVFNLAGVQRTREEGALTARISSADGNIDEFHYTGEQPRFGASGFEAFLSTTPRVGDYTVQLLGITGAAISEKVTVQTRVGCDENVVVIEFTQNYPY